MKIKKDVWTVKYRPHTLDDIIGNEQSVTTIRQLIRSNNLPHLVFHGPINSGKASVAFALAHEIYGEEYERNFTYFNASDFFDQGKQYLVRDKRFIRIIGTDDPKKINKSVISIFKEIINEYAGMGSLDADYKVIFIDNAESLNSDAQHALRRIMEKYTATCRFILSTTQPSRLIPPLRSRGLQLFFTYVSDAKLIEYVNSIAAQEELTVSDDALDAIAYHSKGNLAKALLTMQIASMSLRSGDNEISQQLIYETVLSEIPEDITRLFESALAGDIIAARKVIDKLLIEDGLSGSEILGQLHDIVVTSNEKDTDIAKYVNNIAEADLRMLDASNDRIQLEAMVANF
ncbi:MAG: AAA family ATPase [Methanosarcinaceae archaeon]|nr:AAA family ATPase [Methanosarcinaceae archaeon]